MTVGEMIKELETFNPKLEVLLDCTPGDDAYPTFHLETKGLMAPYLEIYT